MIKQMEDRIKVGCCGFPVARKRYCREFEVVEIQKTFYQPPSLSTITRWKEEAPLGFEFTIKAWQLITHPPSSPTYRKLKESVTEEVKDLYGFFRPTPQVFSAWKRIKEIARMLGGKIIVFQSPPSFKPTPVNEKNIREFFRKIERQDFILVWEPRGKWTTDKISSICSELDLIHCVDPFKDKPALSGKIRYFRLHGKGGYKYQYKDEELIHLKKLCNFSGTTYVMFNNTYMFEDAARFKKLIL